MKIDIAISKIGSLTTSLTNSRLAFLVGHVLRLPNKMATEHCTTADALKLAIADWLTTMRALGDDAQQIVLTEFCQLLDGYAASLENEKSEVPVGTLAVIDGRFVAFRSGETAKMYDLNSDTFVEKLPYLALTCVSCDLSVLMLRLNDRVQEIVNASSRCHDKSSENPSTSVA